ncbi:MAG: DUF5053 domain-containing protein [Bacteroidaceae bacterium]|nr:DUF5053 domain-containing protein [Bacteroidaceae bacterium]
MSNFDKDMKKLEKLYKEHKQEEFTAHFTQMKEKYPSEDFGAIMLKFVKGNYQQMKEEVQELAGTIELYKQVEPFKEIVPFKYIAEHYFGKSAAWLTQRIKGTPVRGRIYTLKPAEIDTFNTALHDIGARLGSISIC